MQPMVRTLIFVGLAAGSAAAAYVTHRATAPAAVVGFEKVGEPFYPDFGDASKAAALRVAAWDDGKSKPKTFTVEFHDGQWRIPSHHNYPAEAKERLGKSAASVVHLERAALASRWKSEHERLGVVDPLDEEVASSKGRGRRLTLYANGKDGGQRPVLADFIVGNEVKDRPGYYYVRRPDESETYLAKLDLDLSTKFSDWIQRDLLKLNASDVLTFISQRPIIDQLGRLVGEDRVELHRDRSWDPWQMDGLDAQTEEVNANRVRELVDNIAALKIVGVRKKPAGLGADLHLDPKVSRDARRELLLVQELESKGYFLRELKTGERRLFSEGGELIAATGDGLKYHLHFGDALRGSEDEIEIGGTTPAESGDAKSADKTEKTDGEAKADGQESDETGKGLQLSRYLFVRVEFDPSLLGEKPVAPTEPEKPEGLDAKKTDEKSADAKDGAKSADKAAEKAGDPKKAEYETALAKYRAEKAKYDQESKQYEEKQTKGRERADVLNQRYGEWYYVIDAAKFEELKISRADLVQPRKTPPAITPLTPLTPPTSPTATTPSEPEPVAAPTPPMETK